MVLEVVKVSGQDAEELTVKLNELFIGSHIGLRELAKVKMLQDAAGFHCLVFFEKRKPSDKIECPYGNEEDSNCQFNKKGFCKLKKPRIKPTPCLSWKQKETTKK